MKEINKRNSPSKLSGPSSQSDLFLCIISKQCSKSSDNTPCNRWLTKSIEVNYLSIRDSYSYSSPDETEQQTTPERQANAPQKYTGWGGKKEICRIVQPSRGRREVTLLTRIVCRTWPSPPGGEESEFAAPRSVHWRSMDHRRTECRDTSSSHRTRYVVVGAGVEIG